MAAAVDDRDNDVPVVLRGLCLSSSHDLFGLIERDRSAIVTDTFVNRHDSLPFTGAAQHANNVSEPLGQSDFAERDLWNIWSQGAPHQSCLILDARITLARLSVSSAMSLPNSAGDPGSTTPPRSASRVLILGSARPALISLLSFSTISAGVAFG